MKRIFALFAVLLFLVIETQAQWNWYNPKPMGESIYDIEFVSDNVAYACGSVGHVIKTTNGGNNWYSLGCIADDYLLSISFINESVGWAFGYYGSVYKTVNGGNLWIKLDDNISGEKFTSGLFFNENNGILGCESGKIFLTSDGGESWTKVSSNTYKIHDVFFYNGQLGFVACDSGIILKTSNGGQTWTSYDTEDTYYFSSIFFTSENIGYVCGFQCFFKTSNGGQSWTKINVNEDENFEYVFFDCYFIDDDHGYLIGDCGNISYTSNGGLSWNTSSLNYDQTYMAIDGTDNGSVFIGSDLGFIYKLDNNGETMVQVTESFTNERLYSIEFINNNEGIAVGTDGTLLKTNQGGCNWDLTNLGEQYDLTDVKYLTQNKIIITASNGNVFISENAGETWDSYDVKSNFNIVHMDFINDTVGWVVGYDSDGAICKTTDGGYTWESQNSGFEAYLFDVTFTTEQEGYIAAPYGTILKTTDGGENWTSIVVGSEDDKWYSIDNVGTDTIYACGAYGKIANSFDAGLTWTINIVVPNYWLKYIDIMDDGIGYCTGWSGVFLKTNDYGVSWNQLPRFTNLELHKIIRNDNMQLFAVGQNGAILSNRLDPRNISLIDVVLESCSSGVYPNPVDNILIINDDVEKYLITDISGKRIKCGGKQNTIEVSNLFAGIYILRYVTDKGVNKTEKFIVSH